MLIKLNFNYDKESLKKIIEVANTDEIVELDDHSFVKIVIPGMTDAKRKHISETSEKDGCLFFTGSSAFSSKSSLAATKGLFSYTKLKLKVFQASYSGCLAYGAGKNIYDFQIQFKLPFNTNEPLTKETLAATPGASIEKGTRCTIL